MSDKHPDDTNLAIQAAKAECWDAYREVDRAGKLTWYGEESRARYTAAAYALEAAEKALYKVEAEAGEYLKQSFDEATRARREAADAAEAARKDG